MTDDQKLELTLTQLHDFGNHLVDDAFQRCSQNSQALIQKAVKDGIDKHLNGGIEELKEIMKNHSLDDAANMQKILPIIQAYEESRARDELIKDLGNKITWWSKIVMAVAIVYVVIKYGLASLIINNITKP